jgi:integrase
VWIEQNILLSLDSVPFDKNNATLVPEAGSCVECPRRTGFNTLLFGTAVHDACTDGACYINKLAKHVERQIAEKPKLVQITTEYGTRGGDGPVRRLAYEAADSGLLSPELAAGIRRVKGVKHLGQRSGNWLNIDQAQLLVEKSDGDGLRNKRDFAMISILLGCGLRRAELASLNIGDIQIRQGHWAIFDLVGKGGHVRTVPMPAWEKNSVDQWLAAAELKHGRIFRAVSRHGSC